MLSLRTMLIALGRNDGAGMEYPSKRGCSEAFNSQQKRILSPDVRSWVLRLECKCH